MGTTFVVPLKIRTMTTCARRWIVRVRRGYPDLRVPMASRVPTVSRENKDRPARRETRANRRIPR
jgi:hypothetical protein